MPKRRRGSRSARLIPRQPSRHRRFEDLVDEALATIPAPFDAALDEVAIVIADEPTLDQTRRAAGDGGAHGPHGDHGDHGEGGDTLYGLYEGVARTEYGADWILVPNTITLFRLPLEADFPDPEDLADEVWITVIHELAHHLGMDDDRLHELGYA